MTSLAPAQAARKPSTKKPKTELRPPSGSVSMRVKLHSGEYSILPYTNQAGEDGYRLTSRDGEVTFLSDLYPLLRGLTILIRIVADTPSKGEVENIYGLSPIDIDPLTHDVGYELCKAKDGERYHIVANQYGVECTCGDWMFRRQHAQDETLRDCKHCRALRAFRLI